MYMHSVLDVNADDWETEILKSDTLVVVDFWHEQCPWCKRLEPIYSEVSEEYKDKVKFAKINVLKSHENQHVAVQYGIMGTPTLVFFCDGRPVETVTGFQPKERLKQLVDDVIDKHRECVEKSTELKVG
ncbi:MAG: thioredoxin family protein [Candidatus Bathyarchaeota archaeon]|nr:thioredoxin family protein [Candidatus Bathyarchaeota archaeon]MDH5713101.1 thioredoxin family protein [Candidatus Bathyarchaeota archaeon]